MKQGLDKLIANIEANKEAARNAPFESVSTYTRSIGDEALIYGLAEIRDELRRINSTLTAIALNRTAGPQEPKKGKVLRDPRYIPVRLRRDLPTIDIHMATKERPQDTLCGIEFRYHSYKDPCTVVMAPLDEAVTCQYCIAISMGLNPETRTPETTEEQ